VDEDTRTLALDKARCAGCGWCLEACPFGAIGLDGSTKTIVVCDLCQGQDQPQCIRFCRSRRSACTCRPWPGH